MPLRLRQCRLGDGRDLLGENSRVIFRVRKASRVGRDSLRGNVGVWLSV